MRPWPWTTTRQLQRPSTSTARDCKLQVYMQVQRATLRVVTILATRLTTTRLTGQGGARVRRLQTDVALVHLNAHRHGVRRGPSCAEEALKRTRKSTWCGGAPHCLAALLLLSVEFCLVAAARVDIVRQLPTRTPDDTSGAQGALRTVLRDACQGETRG